MTAKSPSCSVKPEEGRICAVKPGEMLGVELSASVIVNGEKVPLSTAETGSGFAPPIGTVLPSNDSPSPASVKYDDPNVVLEPSLKFTSRLRPERFTGDTTGKSGGSEFAPVRLAMSNEPKFPGAITSHDTYPIG